MTESKWHPPGTRDRWILAGIVLAGLLLRLVGLPDAWLNPDEGIYYSVATWPDWASFWDEVRSNTHPPLYYLLVKAMAAVSLDFTWLRSLSLLFGVIAIVAFYLATKELVGPTAGLLAAGLVAGSQAVVVQSQVIRPYTLQLACLGVALWFLGRWARRHDARDLMGWCVAIGLALLAHYGSLVVWVAANVAIVFFSLGGRIPRRAATAWGIAQLPMGGLLAALWLGHVVPDVLGSRHQAGAVEGWLQWCFHESPWEGLSALAGIVRFGFFDVPIAMSSFVLLVGLWGVVVQRQWLLCVLVLAGAATAAGLSLAGLYPMCGMRHSMYLLALLIPCMASGLALGLSFVLRSGSRSWLGAASVVLAALLLFLPLDSVLTQWAPARSPAAEHCITREAVENVRPVLDRAHSDGGILVLGGHAYFSLLPLFSPHRVSSNYFMDERIFHFRWGEADVIISPYNELRPGRREVGASDHVFGFLRTIDRDRPELGLMDGRMATLVYAGWSLRKYALLPAVDRGLAGPACISSFAEFEGIGWFRLDPRRCVAKLR